LLIQSYLLIQVLFWLTGRTEIILFFLTIKLYFMLKKTLKISIALFLFGNASFAQWSGSTTTSGNAYRDGNVGIGTTNPSAKLEITDAGNATLRVGITSNIANSNAQFLNSLAVAGLDQNSVTTNGAVAWNFYNNGNNPSWSGALLEHYGSNVQTGEYTVDTRNIGLLKFQNVSTGVIGSNGSDIIISAGNTNLNACFLPNGNVGIGTRNPGNFKLAVEGKIAARGVKVTTANFADYVFEPTYKLRPLSSVESYINENKHLPGMPSAKEVEKEGGFELGNMNVKLLEKIEELTLYVIELKKENEQMKKEIKEISKRNN
jgi:hypothetical protein